MSARAFAVDLAIGAMKSRPRENSGLLPGVSVIVPVGAGDHAWKALLADLSPLGAAAEVLVVGAEPEPEGFRGLASQALIACPVRWVSADAGRAHQMNAGASASSGMYLWFLHCDSRLDFKAINALDQALVAHPLAIHYFDLKFLDDGPAATRFNELGVRFRSRWLGLPFGDQGLCLSRDMFNRLGRFDEEARFGEDHLLIWAAHRRGIAVRGVRASIATSGRKYAAGGWLRTTALHLWRTCRQGLPEVGRLFWSRLR